MSDIWYKKIGFYSNPFSIKTGDYDNELVAYDISSVYKKIDKGQMLFIEGDYGSGKTTILKKIISEFRGKNKLIYYSFNSGDAVFNLKELLNGANSLMRKIIGVNEKNIIMLLDEVHLMKANDAKKLLIPYKEGTIKSIVFVSHDYDYVVFPEEIKPMLNGNIIKTINLSAQEAILLVRKRIGQLDTLDDKSISKIFLLAKKNPRRLLEYCEDVLKYAIEIGDDKVTDYHIGEVLGYLIKEKKKRFEKARRNSEVIVEEKTGKKEEELIKPKIKKTLPKKEKSEKKETKKEEMQIVIPISEKKEPIEIEIKQREDEFKERKFKVNKLVAEPSKNSLGTIAEKEETEDSKQEEEKKKDEKAEETPEYKIYFVDE